jgi:hypothetical protein
MLASGFGNTARFLTRSQGSDRRADLMRVTQVIEVVEQALNASKSERDGLGRRVSDALSVAAMLVGNGTDEYVEREIADVRRLREYEAEIANGQRRLDHLDYVIGQLECLKSEIMARLSPVLSTRER